MKSKNWFLVGVGLMSFAFVSLTIVEITKDPWVIPANYKTMKNKVPTSAQSIADGKAIYQMSCISCHGATGKGDGAKAKNLTIELMDLSSAAFQTKFTDGEIYYQSYVGRIKTHNFEKAFPDEDDRWNVVNYIRSLKK